MFRTQPVPVALVEAVNVLGSDTDTIATMTGAIMGAVSIPSLKENYQTGSTSKTRQFGCLRLAMATGSRRASGTPI